MKVDTNMKKRASKVDKEKNETGWMSTIEGITCDDPRKLRGARVYGLYFEESGSNPSLIDTYTQARALVDILGRRVGSRFVFGCVCAGTKIWTRDGRCINIEDLNILDGIIGFDKDHSTIEPIIYLNPPAKKECVEIKVSSGESLRCSIDHPIYKRITHRLRNKIDKNKRKLTYSWEFCRADSLKVGDIIGECDLINAFGVDTLFDPYLVGLLIGDGSYGYNDTPKLANCDEEVLNYVKNKYEWSLNASHITSDNKLYEEIRIKKICPNLRYIGIYGLTKNKKRLPINYQTLTKEDTALLLAGLFDTDGYITNKRITLTSSTKELLELIKILLRKFGIRSSITKTNPCIKAGRKDKNPWYVLHITNYQSIVNFKNAIPIKIKYKLNALNTIPLRKDNHNVQNGIQEVRITSITPIGEQNIYNLTAGNSHTYLANNLITHNTAGDKGPNLAGLKSMFYNPEDYSILPYRHRYSRTGEVSLTGYFIPSFSMWFGTQEKIGFDNRGVVDEARAKLHYELQWAKISNPKILLKDKAEYCFTPEDAFVLEGGEVFDSEKLAELQMNIEQLKSVELPKRANLFWPYDSKTGMVDKDKKPNLKFEPSGKVLVSELPIVDEAGVPISNLYVMGVDAIDAGKETSTGLDDVSKYAIVVLRRAYGLLPAKIVAIYKERPDNPEDAHNMVIKLALFYNAKVLFEATRVSIFYHFKKENKLNYFLRRPKATLSSRYQNANLFGCPATDSIILHQVELILQYVFDHYDQINFLDIIDELQRYSFEAKRKFDYVAALGMAMLADEDMMSKLPKAASEQNKKIHNIGFYTNEYGLKQFGVIPDKQLGPPSLRFGWFTEKNPGSN